MKKIVIILVSAFYFISIVLIAFLGIRAEVDPSKIITNVESIVLDEVKGDEDGKFEYHYDGVDNNKNSLVYEVLTRPTEDEINNSTGTDMYGNLWNIAGEKMNFIVTIYNFNYIYDNDNWIRNESKGTFRINASVLPTNSSIQKLTYSATNQEDITLSESGLIKFTKLEEITRFTVKISSTDGSNVKSNVRFISQKYL